jgi:hypothetical protein
MGKDKMKKVDEALRKQGVDPIQVTENEKKEIAKSM